MKVLNSPVLFLIFNRPEVTKRTFACIREAKPKRLYISADGPRAEKSGEVLLCEEAREIATAVDWPCDVKTLFRKRNLGCSEAVTSGITWFFQHEAEGIILEDDLLIHPDFFTFCDEMLEKYRNIDKIMNVHGNNFHFGLRRGVSSYYFSCFPDCWGWATWARAWEKNDYKMHKLDMVNQKIIPKLFKSPAIVKYFRDVFLKTKKDLINTWDYRWQYSVWLHGGLCISPEVNLVKNIGFGNDATHTISNTSIFANLDIEPLANITHPTEVVRDIEADHWTANIQLLKGNLIIENLVQEAVRRLELGLHSGVIGITKILRQTYGQLPILYQLDALSYMSNKQYKDALQAATCLLELIPQSIEARSIIKAAKNAINSLQ